MRTAPRFTILAIALASLLPIVERPGGGLMSPLQTVAEHLGEGRGGAPLLVLPSVAALTSLAMPSARAKARLALALAAIGAAAVELVLVYGRPGFAPWFGLDASIPAPNFARHAWMMALLSSFWFGAEHRPSREAP